MKGTNLLCRTLTELGVNYVFGLPGTQTVGIYDALHNSSIRSVLCTQELAAAFMANGYARASGKAGIILAIPGPGFIYALGGLAEARADSAPLILITLAPALKPGRAFQHQAIPQTAIVAPLVKDIIEVNEIEEIPEALTRAHALALGSEPGPVLFQVFAEALEQTTTMSIPALKVPQQADLGALDQLVTEMSKARRPIILAGQGATETSTDLVKFVERLGIPLVTTLSGRGVIPEDHFCAMGFDSVRGNVDALMALFTSSDLILTLGAKLSHNGTAGFTFKLPSERLIHVDTDPTVLNANYPAKLVVQALVEDALRVLTPAIEERTEWTIKEITEWRMRIKTPVPPSLPEPWIHGLTQKTPQAFFKCIRDALPRDAIVVTDAGLHQNLTRRYFEVLSPRGLILPSDFQSMGFGLPAAIGAKLAAPERTVVAIIGDGGLLMSGMELLTAVRLCIPLTVIVFNDGCLNLIRLQQLKQYAHEHDTRILTPDLKCFAEAMGVRYLQAAGDFSSQLLETIVSPVPTLIEVLVGDSMNIVAMRAKSLVRSKVRTVLGEHVLAWIRKTFRSL